MELISGCYWLLGALVDLFANEPRSKHLPGSIIDIDWINSVDFNFETESQSHS